MTHIGIATRPANEADYAAFLRLFPELGVPDPTPPLDRFVEQLVPRMVVACTGDAMIGYATWRPYGQTAHVMNVVMDPVWRGKRVGQQLLEHVRADVRAAGCTRWYLNVKRDNEPALRLYRRCGFEQEDESWLLKMPWSAALALPDAPGHVAEPLTQPDDAAIGARFAISAERMASLRARPGGLMLVLRETASGTPVGFAPFSPDYPGTAPFSVGRPELAGALLRACHAYTLHAKYDYVHIAVEHDAPLYEVLVSAGATLVFAIVQLGGSL